MEKYKEIQKEEILFKIDGENETNKIINYSIPLLNEVFKDLKGKQILKAGADVARGELLKKYKDKIDLILRDIENKFKTEDITPLIYLEVNSYSIYLNIKLRFNNLKKDGFLYYDGYKYILDIENKTNFCEFYPFEPIKPINKEEQLKIFYNCLDLLEKLDFEKSKLRPYILKDMVK